MPRHLNSSRKRSVRPTVHRRSLPRSPLQYMAPFARLCGGENGRQPHRDHCRPARCGARRHRTGPDPPSRPRSPRHRPRAGRARARGASRSSRSITSISPATASRTGDSRTGLFRGAHRLRTPPRRQRGHGTSAPGRLNLRFNPRRTSGGLLEDGMPGCRGAGVSFRAAGAGF
jgi:hypothetical protein